MAKNDEIGDLLNLLEKLNRQTHNYELLKESLLAIDAEKLAIFEEQYRSEFAGNSLAELRDYWNFVRLEDGFRQVIGNINSMSSFAFLGLICRLRAGAYAEQDYVNFARGTDSLLKKIWLDLGKFYSQDNSFLLGCLRTINQYIHKNFTLQNQDLPKIECLCLDQVLKYRKITYLSLILLFYLICENLSVINADNNLCVDYYRYEQLGTQQYSLRFRQYNSVLWLYDRQEMDFREIATDKLRTLQAKLLSKAEFFQVYLQNLSDLDLLWRQNIYNYILRMF